MTSTASTLTVLAALAGAFVACNKDAPTPTAAEQPAAPAVKPTAAPGTVQAAKQPETPGEAIGQAVGALAQLAKAADQAQGGNVQGKVVSWRALAAFVPEKLGELPATAELDGSTGGMGGMQLSRVTRLYGAGAKQGKIEIADATLVPMMRAGFAIAATVNEDSTRGTKRGIKLDGQPGVVEWQKASQQAKGTLLVAGRYIVSVELWPAKSADAALAPIKALDLKKLAALKAE